MAGLIMKTLSSGDILDDQYECELRNVHVLIACLSYTFFLFVCETYLLSLNFIAFNVFFMRTTR